MIEKIEDTPPKIQSWNNLHKLHTTIKARKDRIYNSENIDRTLGIIKEKIDEAERKLSATAARQIEESNKRSKS